MFDCTFVTAPNQVFCPCGTTGALIYAALYGGELSRKSRVLDLCTGAGLVAIVLSANVPGMLVEGVDVSWDAIQLARHNNSVNETEVDFHHMDVFGGWKNQLHNKNGKGFNLITANPPYWGEEIVGDARNKMAKCNPIGALLGGKDGMDFHRRIVDEAVYFLAPEGRLCLEMDPRQEEKIRHLLRDNFHEPRIYKDYRGVNRAISAEIDF